ncbi:hypothetical protein [Stappia indica]|uniref:hypothetical protein n=1 Tax=Stappia indica TaxID=538381 RepID=UPI001D17ED37|nr:hypothetical protein [Stappia indica]MCC4242959.1 hypothetical protein [Stappia indica]
MIPNILTDVVPRALLAGGLAWGAVNYVLIGPKLAERVAAADHLPACTANMAALAARAGEEQLAALPLPQVDVAAVQALTLAEGMLRTPLVDWAYDAANSGPGGLGSVLGFDPRQQVADARRAYERSKQAAMETWQRSRDQVLASTASRLAASDDICGCIADVAIAETRMDWALYTGSLTLYRPASIDGFAGRMAQAARAGACERQAGGAS